MSVLNWIELNWIELNWIELNWIELNWIELNWIELNWIELNWIELNWIEDKIASNLQFLDHTTVVNLNRTKRYLFDLKCTKIAGGWGSASDPDGGAYSAIQLLDGLGGEENERRGERREEEGTGRTREGGMCPPFRNPKYATLTEPPPQTPPPLNIGLPPRTQITSSFATYAIFTSLAWASTTIFLY